MAAMRETRLHRHSRNARNLNLDVTEPLLSMDMDDAQSMDRATSPRVLNRQASLIAQMDALRIVQRLESKRRNELLESRVPNLQNLLAPRDIVRIDAEGNAELRKVGRNQIIDEFDLAHRDLRAVDPTAAAHNTTAILIRERALVVNLQVLRVIIGADQIYVLSSLHTGTHKEQIGGDESLRCKFVRHLRERLSARSHELSVHSEGSMHGSSMHGSEFGDAGLPKNRDSWGRADLELPYELQALDVALGEALRHLQHETSALLNNAMPCLENLSRKVSARHLQTMMELNNDRARLAHRLEALKYHIDDIMKDDADMLDMYLGRRVLREAGFHTDEDSIEPPVRANSDPVLRQVAMGSSAPGPIAQGLHIASSMPARSRMALARPDPSPFAAVQPNANHQHTQEDVLSISTMSPPQHWQGSDGHPEQVLDDDPAVCGTIYAIRKSCVKRVGPVDPHDVEEVEGLLETYLIQVDFLLGKLQHLTENNIQMERMVNIDLDHKRNQLVGLDLLVTAITLMFSVITAVSGVFGMNMTNGWEDSHTAFVVTVVLSVLGGALLLGAFLVLVQVQGLLFIPDLRAFKLQMPSQL